MLFRYDVHDAFSYTVFKNDFFYNILNIFINFLRMKNNKNLFETIKFFYLYEYTIINDTIWFINRYMYITCIFL